MNKQNNENITLEEYENEFSYKKSKSNLKIDFNRIAFIFFIFFTISIIYSIQLLHLGSLKLNIEERAFKVSEAISANEAFISSATTLILPVIEIDNNIIGNGNIGPITKILRDTYIKISKHNSI